MKGQKEVQGDPGAPCQEDALSYMWKPHAPLRTFPCDQGGGNGGFGLKAGWSVEEQGGEGCGGAVGSGALLLPQGPCSVCQARTFPFPNLFLGTDQSCPPLPRIWELGLPQLTSVLSPWAFLMEIGA